MNTTVTEARTNWLNLLNDLRKIDPALCKYIERGRIVYHRYNKVRVLYPLDDSRHMQKLNAIPKDLFFKYFKDSVLEPNFVTIPERDAIISVRDEAIHDEKYLT